MHRAIVPIGLIAAGAAAAIAVPIADDPTWQAIWVGLASTGLSSGLVDGSALLEARSREQAILLLVGARVAEVHRALLAVIGAVFDIPMQPPGDLPGRLHSFHKERDVVFASPIPNQAPPITMQGYLMQQLQAIEIALNSALALAVLTDQATRLQRLDDLAEHGPFLPVLRAMVVQAPQMGFQSIRANQKLAEAAADSLEAIQAEFRFFANQAGAKWRAGQV